MRKKQRKMWVDDIFHKALRKKSKSKNISMLQMTRDLVRMLEGKDERKKR